MLKSCKYCGRIHDSKTICSKKPIIDNTKHDKLYTFRNSAEWQHKRTEIKERDNYLCQICIRGLHNTTLRVNTKEIQVHHIKPLRQHWQDRLDNDNLICLCTYHHEMAESGEISSNELMRMTAQD
jgi:predicted restriction endonuclease